MATESSKKRSKGGTICLTSQRWHVLQNGNDRIKQEVQQKEVDQKDISVKQ